MLTSPELVLLLDMRTVQRVTSDAMRCPRSSAFLVEILLVLAIAAATYAGESASTPAPRPGPEEFKVVGITAPSKTARLAAVLPARIAQIPAAEGSVVHQGDVVVKLDDSVQRARTEIARAAAESVAEVELAGLRWDHARREQERLTRLHGDDHASSKELADAHTDAEMKRLELGQARFEHEQAVRVFERERKQWDEFFLRAPFTGYVAEHLKQAGESVDQLEGIVVLTQLDPLHAVVDCPVVLAPFVGPGDRAEVRPVDSRWPPRTGTVVLASRVADGASQTFKVKVSVPNEDRRWLAGLKVVVDFATDHTAAADGVSGDGDRGE